MKKYLTEIYINGKTYCHYVMANNWFEAEELCAVNEKVVGEFIKEITLEEN